MIVEITNQNYNEYVNENSGIVILDFGATFCAPCKTLNFILEEIEKENKNITIAKINIEENTDIATNFGVMTVPVMVILKNNKVIEKINGLKDKEFIEKIINNI